MDAIKYLFKKGTQVGEEGVVEDLERKRFVPQEYLKEVTNDVSVEDSRARADRRCEGSFVAAMEGTVEGYTSCSVKEENIRLKRGKVQYALMPVWILNTKWEGKDYLFAMNGQTGKLVGNLPVSKKRVLGLFSAIAAPLLAAAISLGLLLVR